MENEGIGNAIKGLFSYKMVDSFLYDLDSDQIENFARQFERSQFIVVSGNSGIGKTSFLNCIFNEVFYDRTGFTNKNIIVSIRPGIDPIKNIAIALSTIEFSDKKQQTGFVKETVDLLNNSSNGLFELFLEYPVKQGYQLIFIIDPLDDLFMFAGITLKSKLDNHRQQIDNFINLLCTFEKKSISLPVKTVISFSNIFPEKIGRYPKFSDLVEKKSFLFKGISINNAAEIIKKLIPKEWIDLDGIDVFENRLLLDLKKEYQNTIEWLFFLQHALKKTFQKLSTSKDISAKALCDCYDEIGGVKSSIEFEANTIYDENIKKIDPLINEHYKGKLGRIFEFFFRAMMDVRGEFSARSYQSILDMSDSFYLEDREYIENELLIPFIKAFGDEGLGFFEIVYSEDEIERTNARANKKYLAGSDIISIRNKILVTKWSQWRVFQNLKIKLITEYEWYSKISFDQKKSNNYNFPTTLQTYALYKIQEEGTSIALKDEFNNAISDNTEEFNVINELLMINKYWGGNEEVKNVDGFSTVEGTQAYIKLGVDYWTRKIENETTSRLNKIKQAKLKTKYIAISFLVFLFVIYPIYRYEIHEFDDLKARFDCMVSENNRMITYLDDQQINKLSEYALCNTIADTIVESLNEYTDEFKKKLQINSDEILKKSTELYDLNEFQYILHCRKWACIADTCRKRDSTLFVDIYSNILISSKILTVDTSDFWYERYMKDPDSIIALNVLKYPRVPYFVSYDSLSKETKVFSNDSTKTIYRIPSLSNRPISNNLPIPYFLNCLKCSEEDNANRKITIHIE